MKNSVILVILALVHTSLFFGCGGDASAPTLAPATGVVTYKGSALAGATVTFLPSAGPLAIGMTDMKGEFKLNTGALPGCTVGPVKVAVTIGTADEGASSAPVVSTGPVSPAEMEAQSRKMAEATMAHQKADASKPKSLIPARYKDATTSGLSFTVDADGAKNVFKIELQD